jgi:hypothetical protein
MNDVASSLVLDVTDDSYFDLFLAGSLHASLDSTTNCAPQPSTFLVPLEARICAYITK